MTWQVALGAFVSRDRDTALNHMVALAASKYSPDQDLVLWQSSTSGGGGGGSAGGVPDGADGMPGHAQPSSCLKKISLSSVSEPQLGGGVVAGLGLVVG